MHIWSALWVPIAWYCQPHRMGHRDHLNLNKAFNGFRDLPSAKSGPNFCQIWKVFGQWASPYEINGQMTMTVHNYRSRKFHRTSNGEIPSSGYQGCTKWRTRRTSPPQADFDMAKKWFQNQAEQTFSPTRLINMWNNIYLIILNMNYNPYFKFNLVHKHKICQIMSVFTQNRQCYGERKWGILTDLWGDPVHRIS